METEKQRIEELVKQLNAASAAYYNGQDEIMPNYEWDALFDELTTLEEKQKSLRNLSKSEALH